MAKKTEESNYITVTTKKHDTILLFFSHFYMHRKRPKVHFSHLLQEMRFGKLFWKSQFSLAERMFMTELVIPKWIKLQFQTRAAGSGQAQVSGQGSVCVKLQ